MWDIQRTIEKGLIKRVGLSGENRIGNRVCGTKLSLVAAEVENYAGANSQIVFVIGESVLKICE
jgi:hypothetical protein